MKITDYDCPRHRVERERHAYSFPGIIRRGKECGQRESSQPMTAQDGHPGQGESPKVPQDWPSQGPIAFEEMNDGFPRPLLVCLPYAFMTAGILGI
jgi:hypothetical protein